MDAHRTSTKFQSEAIAERSVDNVPIILLSWNHPNFKVDRLKRSFGSVPLTRQADVSKILRVAACDMLVGRVPDSFAFTLHLFLTRVVFPGDLLRDPPSDLFESRCWVNDLLPAPLPLPLVLPIHWLQTVSEPGTWQNASNELRS